MTSPAHGIADVRQSAPAAARNREPLLAALTPHLPRAGLVLEIASGSGEHACFFARSLPHLTWQPSDPDLAAQASIEAWSREAALPNLLPPLTVDAALPPWSVSRAEAVVCINMIHISPWQATVGLMRGAGQVLAAGGLLATYGPYRIDGAQTAPSNAAFEDWLKARDPAYGIRDVADVAAEARDNGLTLVDRIAMPANNFTLIFRKAP